MIAKMTEAEILWLIAENQAIQKSWPSTHAMWKNASTILDELFGEMARRSKQ